MKSIKPLILLLIGLTLVFVTITVTAQYDDWTYEDPTAPWAFWGLFTGALCFIPVLIFIIWIVLAVWVYKDAERRGSSGALWLIIVIITGIIGLIIWLIVRPPEGGKQATGHTTPPPPSSAERRCPACGRAIPDDARVCPYCEKNFEQ